MLLDTRYNRTTEQVIGAAMQVHRLLGNGFQEVIYQRALAFELEERQVGFVREVEVPIFYKQKEIGSRRVDFLVEEMVLVELKALAEITPVHHAQIINYLNAYQLEIGLLINFGEPSLRFKRFIKTRSNY
ncbi:GxxExxY protein [Hymenobacter psychrotolerans]|nr:GxxExxY protein [Hymenobacter psychrotolerans]